MLNVFRRVERSKLSLLGVGSGVSLPIMLAIQLEDVTGEEIEVLAPTVWLLQS